MQGGEAVFMSEVWVFFDSDTVSAGCATMRGYYSASRALLVIAAAGLVRGVVSEQVLAEVRSVLATRLAHRALEAGEILRELVEGYFVVVPDPTPEQVQPFFPQVTDLDDAPILAAAVLSGCRVLVTFNTRHYGKAVGIQGMRPDAFMALMRQAICEAIR